MGYNKLVLNGSTLIDLTSDTVSSDVLLQGYKAHNKAGSLVTGNIPLKNQDSIIKDDINGTITIPMGYYQEDVVIQVEVTPPEPEIPTDSIMHESVGTVIYIGNDAYRIIHQGLPESDIYDDSCSGTWVWKEVLLPETAAFKSSNYADTDVYAYLTSWFSGLSESIKSHVKTVKIPYCLGSTVQVGANGLSTKVFSLSGRELGWIASSLPDDGYCLDYFVGMANSDPARKKKTPGGSYESHSARTYVSGNRRQLGVLGSSGGPSQVALNVERYVAPAFILDEFVTINNDKEAIFE